MASKVRKTFKTKSSITYCHEKYSCNKSQAEAVVYCEDCGSNQCSYCDQAIHNKSRNRYHERKNIDLPDNILLCQNTCMRRNFADVVCQGCDGLVLCHDCFELKHPVGSKRQSHKKDSFQKYDKKNHIIVDGKLKPNDCSSDSNFDLREIDLDSDLCQNRYSSDDFQTCQFQNDVTQTFGLDLTESNTIPNHTMDNTNTSLPDITINALHASGDINAEGAFEDMHASKGFPLLDQDEKLQVESKEDFVQKLSCKDGTEVKVVSIFGNTGDGKSHTLNETFFRGHQVFQTSSEQSSCTAGAWAAFDKERKAVVIDTEGLLGISKKAVERTRLLLKVLAVSDIIIYRTRAERLGDDIFRFINDAAKAYHEHFKRELEEASKRCKFKISLSQMGPSVIIFHETHHTNILSHNTGVSPEELIRKNFEKLELAWNGFNSVHYAGTRTKQLPTEFKTLQKKVEQLLKDNTVRSPREPAFIYEALKVLNDKFSGNIECSVNSFPDQYFTCTETCLSCRARCSQSVNHTNLKHNAGQDKKCRYQHELENKIYLCKKCKDQGEIVIVVPKAFSSKENTWFGLAKYAWAGYVLECKTCGIIYQSRQHWYGNQTPDMTSVVSDVHHVWPGESTGLQGSQNAARRLVEGIGYVSDSIASVSAKPTMVVRRWVTDQIAPPYWVPNSQITKCKACEEVFSEELSIHHCRRCGQGFCDACSSYKDPVPERGWGHEPVRVCQTCKENKDAGTGDVDATGSEVRPRQVSEAIGSTVGAMAAVVSYPLGVLKDSSRPTYWIPDHEITKCICCKEIFGEKLKIHHCRACGQGVCKKCSTNQKEVPSRGWDQPVRVCDICDKKSGIL